MFMSDIQQPNDDFLVKKYFYITARAKWGDLATYEPCVTVEFFHRVPIGKGFGVSLLKS